MNDPFLVSCLFDEKANVCNITYVHNVFYTKKQQLMEHPKQENMWVVYNILDQKTLYNYHVLRFQLVVYIYIRRPTEREKEMNNSLEI